MRRTPVSSFLNLLGPRSSDFGFTRLQSEAAELRAFLSASGPVSLESRHFSEMLGRPVHATRLERPGLSHEESAHLLRALRSREAVLKANLATELTFPVGTQAPRAANPGHPFWDRSHRAAPTTAPLSSDAISKMVQWSCYGPTFNEPDFTDGLVHAFHAVCRATTGSVQCTSEAEAELHGPRLRRMLFPPLYRQLEDYSRRQMGPLLAGVFHHEVELVGVPRVRHVAVVLGAQPNPQHLHPATSSSSSSSVSSHSSQQPDPALQCSYASTSSVLDGGVVVLSAPGDVQEMVTCRVADSEGNVGSASKAAASFTSSAFALLNSFAFRRSDAHTAGSATSSGPLGWANRMAAAHAAVALRGATVYATVDLDTREFLAARRGQGPTARWAPASFTPWAPATRQWVLASPLWAPTCDEELGRAAPQASQGEGLQPGLGFNSSAEPATTGASWWPQAAQPEWQVVDMDGVLGSHACFAQPLIDAYHAHDGRRQEEHAMSSRTASEATAKNMRSRG